MPVCSKAWLSSQLTTARTSRSETGGATSPPSFLAMLGAGGGENTPCRWFQYLPNAYATTTTKTARTTITGNSSIDHPQLANFRDRQTRFVVDVNRSPLVSVG